jgi:transposase
MALLLPTSWHNIFNRVCAFQDERSVDEIDQVIQQARNDIDLLPEVNRSAIDRLERYKSELAVVQQSVKKHKNSQIRARGRW